MRPIRGCGLSVGKYGIQIEMVDSIHCISKIFQEEEQIRFGVIIKEKDFNSIFALSLGIDKKICIL